MYTYMYILYVCIYIYTQKNTKQATGGNISIQIFWSLVSIQLKCPLLRNTQKSVTSPNNPFLNKLFGLTKKEHSSEHFSSFCAPH